MTINEAKSISELAQHIRSALHREDKVARMSNRIDKRIGIPDNCPNCGSFCVQNANHWERPRRVLDLRFMRNGVKKWVVEVDGKKFRCYDCNYEFEYSLYGRNLLAWCMNQHVTYRVSMENVGKMLFENFRLNVPEYKLFYLKADLAKEYRETAGTILHNMLGGPLIQIDETSAITRDCPTSYVWVVASMDAVYYMYRPNREAGFLHDLLKGFNGVLVSDFYAGYDSLPFKQQRCLVHLIRDLNTDFRKNQLNGELKGIMTEFGVLLRTIIATVDQWGLRKEHFSKHSVDVDRFYRGMDSRVYDTDIAAHYQNRLTRNRGRLFEFLNHDGVPWNNNNAENAVKAYAKYREAAGNLCTCAGLEDYLVLLSIQQTCKYRGISFLEFLRSGRKTFDA